MMASMLKNSYSRQYSIIFLERISPAAFGRMTLPGVRGLCGASNTDLFSMFAGLFTSTFTRAMQPPDKKVNRRALDTCFLYAMVFIT
jgi:hypothetical protein